MVVVLFSHMLANSSITSPAQQASLGADVNVSIGDKVGVSMPATAVDLVHPELTNQTFVYSATKGLMLVDSSIKGSEFYLFIFSSFVLSSQRPVFACVFTSTSLVSRHRLPCKQRAQPVCVWAGRRGRYSRWCCRGA